MTEKILLGDVQEQVDAHVAKIEKLFKGSRVMFCGSTTMDREFFLLAIVPILRAAFARSVIILVGSAHGLDEFVQQYCFENGYFDVQVFIPSEQKDPVFQCPRFMQVKVAGGFKKRDRAMRADCKYAVGFVSQYAGGASGTAAQLISIAAQNGEFGEAYKGLDGYLIVEILRRHALPYNQTLADDVQKKEMQSVILPN